MLDTIKSFFRERLDFSKSKGILKKQIVLDPEMGFFRGASKLSFVVFRRISERHEFDLPLLPWTSRKYFLISVYGGILNYGTRHHGCGRLKYRSLARLFISLFSWSRVGMSPRWYNRVFKKKRRQLVKKIELDENGLRLVWQDEFLLTTESNLIKLCRVDRQLFEIYLRHNLPP